MLQQKDKFRLWLRSHALALARARDHVVLCLFFYFFIRLTFYWFLSADILRTLPHNVHLAFLFDVEWPWPDIQGPRYDMMRDVVFMWAGWKADKMVSLI